MKHRFPCTRSKHVVLVAALTALTGFSIHVFDINYLQVRLFDIPGPHYSPTINALAALTSIENGLGMVVFYALARDALIRYSLPVRAGMLAVILLAIKGSLFRNMIMEMAIAGPGVQTLYNLVPWIIGLSMSFVLVYCYEGLVAPGSLPPPTGI
jgi:hypothetical protein